METIAFFNHKGGVGKTTLVFNIGLALAAGGYNVVFVDLDAQANLTSAALSLDDAESLFLAEETVYGSLKPLVDGSGDLDAVTLMQIRESAWLVPGDLRISEFEEICPQGWTEALAGNLRGFRVSTALSRLVQRAGAEVNADFAFLDLGPNVGALNRTALLASEGFVVPLAPDLFSLTALPSVGKSTSLWMSDWLVARGSANRRSLNLGFDLPIGRPSPLGYVSQQFAVYREAPAAAYKRWIEQIPKAYETGIVEPLRAAGVAIPPGPSRLGEVRNLSSLVPIAQRANRAVFELGGSEARGAQFTRARDTYRLFQEIAEEMVKRVEWVAENNGDNS